MLHFKGSRFSENVMPDIEGGSDSQARISRRRLDVDGIEWCLFENLAVYDAVKSYPTGQTEFFESRKPVESIEKEKHRLFQPGLKGSGYIPVASLNGIVDLPLGAKPLDEQVSIELS
jgi:hypothetical protein